MKLLTIYILIVYMAWDIIVKMLYKEFCWRKSLFSIIYSTDELDMSTLSRVITLQTPAIPESYWYANRMQLVEKVDSRKPENWPGIPFTWYLVGYLTNYILVVCNSELWEMWHLWNISGCYLKHFLEVQKKVKKKTLHNSRSMNYKIPNKALLHKTASAVPSKKDAHVSKCMHVSSTYNMRNLTSHVCWVLSHTT